MPTGPQGQKRPADAIGLAVLIGKIATGEIDETPIRKPRGQAGGETRATSLSAERRTEIASASAGARWDANERRERVMNTEPRRGATAAMAGVRMYPNNQLGTQCREMGDTLSPFTVVANKFFTKR